NAAGYYNLAIAQGNYTISITPANLNSVGYAASCPSSGSANVLIPAAGNISSSFGLTCTSSFDLMMSGMVLTGMISPVQNGSFTPAVFNNACIPTSGTIAVVLDPQINFVSNSNNTNTYTFSGDTISWNFSGLTNLNSNAIWNTFSNAITFLGDPSLQPTDTVCFTVIVTPTQGDINPANNTFNICGPALVAFDPNEKHVSPLGIGSSGEIAPGTTLDYFVQFQNTGTAAARDIFILDTLDADLDLSTLTIIGSSHLMEVDLLSGNVLRFYFPLIWLPDSNTNEPASHGWVRYSIVAPTSLSNGTPIQNTANIYFDFNEPIVTNTTLNTINTGLLLDVSTNLNQQQLSVFPNPASDELDLIFDKSFTGTIMLTDALGRVVLTQRTNASTTAKITLENIPTGVYSLVIFDGEKQVVKKIVVAR
ncbi:MAG: DUF7619 domain-containing protein, partial [Bacteroidia bacterium]